MNHVKIDYVNPEERPAFVLEDVQGASFDHLDLKRGVAAAPFFDLRRVGDFSLEASRGIADVQIAGPVARQKISP
jgi:hypothetical protein